MNAYVHYSFSSDERQVHEKKKQAASSRLFPHFPQGIILFSMLFFYNRGFFQHLFHFLREIFACQHDTMAASFTFDADVCTHSDDLPAILSAWMLFLHLDHIIQAKFLIYHASSPFPQGLIRPCTFSSSSPPSLREYMTRRGEGTSIPALYKLSFNSFRIIRAPAH